MSLLSRFPRFGFELSEWTELSILSFARQTEVVWFWGQSPCAWHMDEDTGHFFQIQMFHSRSVLFLLLFWELTGLHTFGPSGRELKLFAAICFLHVLEIHENPKVDFVWSASKIQYCHLGRHNCLHRRGVWGKMWTYAWWCKCEKSVSSSESKSIFSSVEANATDSEDDCKAHPWIMWWPQRGGVNKEQATNNKEQATNNKATIYQQLFWCFCFFWGMENGFCVKEVLSLVSTLRGVAVKLPGIARQTKRWCYMLDLPPHQMKVHRDSLLKISKNVIMLVLTVTGLGGGSNVCWCWLFQKDFILKLFLKVQKLGFHNWCPYLALGCLVAQIFIAPCVFYILTIINQYDDRLQAKQRAAKLEKDCDAAGSLSDNRKKSVDPLQSGKPKWTLEFFSWDAG